MALIAPVPIASGDPVRRRRPTDIRPAGGSLTGKLAKTDRLEAAMLARMGAVLELS
jgi:hypothetical protein